MAKKYEISKKEAEEIKEYRKQIKEKFTDRRMFAVQLRGEGMRNKDVAEKLSVNKRMVSHWVRQYREGGIENLNKPVGGRRHENMTFEEEKTFLKKYEKEGEKGQIIEISKIKEEYEKLTKPSKSKGQIYKVLHRHGWRKIKPRSQHPKKASDKEIEESKKRLKELVKTVKDKHKDKNIRLMFQDEAGFGRINKPKYCWCNGKIRPLVPCHHIREYRYLYGACEAKTGENFFLILPKCNKEWMNLFLRELSKAYKNDIIILVCDGAGWHNQKNMKIPENIIITKIPPYTPEMNPIEQIWEEIREKGFKNEIFQTLEKVVERLCKTICDLTFDTVKSIMGREWILSIGC